MSAFFKIILPAWVLPDWVCAYNDPTSIYKTSLITILSVLNLNATMKCAEYLRTYVSRLQPLREVINSLLILLSWFSTLLFYLLQMQYYSLVLGTCLKLSHTVMELFHPGDSDNFSFSINEKRLFLTVVIFFPSSNIMCLIV